MDEFFDPPLVLLWVVLRDTFFDALFAARFVGVFVARFVGVFVAGFVAVFVVVLLDRLRVAVVLPLAVFLAAGFFEDLVSGGVACCIA